MRAFRLITCAALALPASACTIWYLATNPYGDANADADIDAQNLDAADDVIVAPPPLRVFSGAGAIAAYDDVLYANVDGTLMSCKDVDTNSCTTLGTLASAPNTLTPVGLTVSAVGVYWVTGDGIWLAGLDGSTPHRAIADVSNPRAVAADGNRLSWTTLRNSTTVINTCKVAATVGCNFDGGVSFGSNQGQLVGADADIDNRQLAAGGGYVAWATTAQNELVNFTAVEGGLTTTYDAINTTLGAHSDHTWVSNDGANIFVSFQGGNELFVVYEATPSTNVLETSPSKGVVQNTKQGDCMKASDGLIGYGPRSQQVAIIGEDGGRNFPLLQWDSDSTPKESAYAFAATTHFYFVLSSTYTLYRFTR